MRRVFIPWLVLAVIAGGWRCAMAAPVLLPDPNLDLRISGYPEAGAVAVDGKTYVGGGFGDANSVFKPGLVRLNPDGSVDTFWTSATRSDVFAVALGNGRVYAAAIRPFSLSPTLYDVHSLSPADGADDATFAVQHSAKLQALVIDGSGNILFGGALGTTTVQGVTHDGNIARVNPAGLLDSGWYPPLQGTVLGIAVINGSVFVAGSCIAQDVASNCRGVVKLLANGAIDPSWTANVGCVSSSLAPSTDNTALYVGCENSGYSAAAVYKLALATGAEVWHWAPVSLADVRALLPLSDGKLYLAGNLRCGTSYCSMLRLAQGDATLDTGWQLSGGYGSWLARRGAVELGLFDNSNFVEVAYNTAPVRNQLAHFTYRVGVDDVACDSLGGRAMLFTFWNLLEAPVSSHYVAMLLPNGQPDYSWHFNGYQVDSYLSSYKAGAFDTDGSLVASIGGAVRFGASGSTQFKLVRFSGAGLAPDTAWVPQLNGGVSGVAIDTAHRVYVAGSGLAGPDDGLVRLDPVSGAVQAWSVNSGLTFNAASKVVLDEKHGRLFVIESGYDQYNIRRNNRLRVYSTAGGPWLWQFPDDSYPNDSVADVAIDGSGYAYVVGGGYPDAGGYVGFDSAGRKPLVKLSPSGNRVTAWSPSGVYSKKPNRLAVVGDRWLYVTDLNTSLVSLRRVTTREPATLDVGFSPNFGVFTGSPLPVLRMCAGSQGRLFLTGSTSIDGNYRAGIAIFGDDDPLLNDSIFYNAFE